MAFSRLAAPLLPLGLLALLFAACSGDEPAAPPGIELVADGAQAVIATPSAPSSAVLDGFNGAPAPMLTVRARHTASLLPGGQVLVTGGNDGAATLASAELYDPQVGAWTSAGLMIQAREQHAAVVLPSGGVLVVGGLDSGGALASVELYDPSTAAWTSLAPMAIARARATITLLPDGKALIAGGTDGSTPLASVEIYDPQANTWTTAAPLLQARARHTATLLDGGRLLITGGLGLSGTLASTELRSPTGGTWTLAAPLATARGRHTATLLPDGSLLVSGGVGAGGLLASAERYHLDLNEWSPAGSMSEARADHTAFLGPLGHVIVAGGQGASGPLATAEGYEPAPVWPYLGISSWFSAGAMDAARVDHSVTVLESGEAVHAGGAAVAEMERFVDIPADAGTPCGAAAQCASGYCANSVCCSTPCAGDGQCQHCDATGTCQVNGNSSPCSPYLKDYCMQGGGVCNGGFCAPSGFQHIDNNCHQSGNCYSTMCSPFASGCQASVQPNGSGQHCDPIGGGPGPCSCMNAAGITMPFPYAIGGQCASAAECASGACSGGLCVTACAGPGCWLPEGSMTSARVEHTATLLPSGKVLFAGGKDAFSLTVVSSWTNAFGAAWLYDPAASTWTVSPMQAPHYGHTATLLPSGKVLIAGGENVVSLENHNKFPPGRLTEIYDPASGTSSATGPLTTARQHHTATLLPSGKVLVIGGDRGPAAPSTTIEIYDDAAGVWSLAAPMPIARDHHTATLLPSGDVLVLGGTASTQVDVYHPGNDTWSLAAPLPAARSKHTATLLAGGKVLVVGGTDGQPLARVDLYDPILDTWSALAPMPSARAGHTATLLPSGDLIVTGGGAGAERYMPVADVWSPAGAMLVTKRHDGTATLLPDGRLVVGFGLLTSDAVAATVNIEVASIGPSSLGQPCAVNADCPGLACADGVCCSAPCDQSTSASSGVGGGSSASTASVSSGVGGSSSSSASVTSGVGGGSSSSTASVSSGVGGAFVLVVRVGEQRCGRRLDVFQLCRCDHRSGRRILFLLLLVCHHEQYRYLPRRNDGRRRERRSCCRRWLCAREQRSPAAARRLVRARLSGDAPSAPPDQRSAQPTARERGQKFGQPSPNFWSAELGARIESKPEGGSPDRRHLEERDLALRPGKPRDAEPRA